MHTHSLKIKFIIHVYLNIQGRTRSVGSLLILCLAAWPVGLGDRRMTEVWMLQACGGSHRAACESHPHLFYGMTCPSPRAGHMTPPQEDLPPSHPVLLSVLDWLVQPKPRWLGGNGWLLDGPEEVLQGTDLPPRCPGPQIRASPQHWVTGTLTLGDQPGSCSFVQRKSKALSD